MLKEQFLDLIKDNFSGDEMLSFVDSMQNPIVKHIRYNPYKSGVVDAKVKPIEWCKDGFTLLEDRIFTIDPLFHSGAYYVQEASSMYIEELFNKVITPNLSDMVVLDLCAAPGGKSTLLSSLIGKDNLLISNEVIKSRASILKENIVKWGAGNVVVTNNDPKDFGKLKGYFDVVLADVPCSGEGMFRKSKKAVEEWSLDGVEMCKLRSQRIIGDVWDSLKEDGYLILSTCTFNKLENEGNIEWICNNFDVNVVEVDLNLFNGKVVKSMTNNHRGYHFYPHRVDSEGFFVTVLQKNSTSGKINPKKVVRAALQKIKEPQLSKLKEITTLSDSVFVKHDDSIYCVADRFIKNIELLLPMLNVTYFGTEIGKDMKGKIRPTHSLAMWSDLSPALYPVVEVELEVALDYLRRQSIPAELFEDGFNIVAYQGARLGFVNRVANRVNNLYPKESMILHL